MEDYLLTFANPLSRNRYFVVLVPKYSQISAQAFIKPLSWFTFFSLWFPRPRSFTAPPCAYCIGLWGSVRASPASIHVKNKYNFCASVNSFCYLIPKFWTSSNQTFPLAERGPCVSPCSVHAFPSAASP